MSVKVEARQDGIDKSGSPLQRVLRLTPSAWIGQYPTHRTRRAVRILVKYTQIVESSRIPGNERQKYCLNPPAIDLGDQIIAESGPNGRSYMGIC
jgi:hypothetical protein